MITSAIVGAVLLVLFIVVAMAFRTVVSTNDVHIVQSSKTTVSFGKDESAGNTYYAWPSWIPFIGIKVIRLPVSVFDLNLDEYAAYDKGRVPFEIDIMGFFRITHPNMAAQRVHSFDELKTQLEGILQGACRSILAKSEIEEILEERSKFGKLFTEATEEQLKEWGVGNVKSIELMDIRDAENSHVIENIMAKKQSLIAMESRIAVAENNRAAKEAEIAASRDVALKTQDAEQEVGQRTALKEKNVGIAQQQAEQEIAIARAETAQKNMEVEKIKIVRAAEIERDKELVAADQRRKANVITAEGQAASDVAEAEGQKKKIELLSEADLTKATNHASGVRAEGLASAEAEKARQLASVAAQTTLAQEIGENTGYQNYLIEIKKIDANQAVGIKQAEALTEAEVKLIINSSGGVTEGLKSASELLGSRGGVQIGALLEGLAQTEQGQRLLAKLGLKE